MEFFIVMYINTAHYIHDHDLSLIALKHDLFTVRHVLVPQGLLRTYFSLKRGETKQETPVKRLKTKLENHLRAQTYLSTSFAYKLRGTIWGIMVFV